METAPHDLVVPYAHLSDSDLQLYELHESYRDLSLKHARALNLIDELRGYHLYGEPIPRSVQDKIDEQNLWPKGQPLRLSDKLKDLLNGESSKLSIHSLNGSLEDLHLQSCSKVNSPTIAFPETPVNKLNSAKHRLDQSRHVLRLDEELDSGFFSKKSSSSKASTASPKSTTPKSSGSPPGLVESIRFPESVVIVKPMQRVDVLPVLFGDAKQTSLFRPTTPVAQTLPVSENGANKLSADCTTKRSTIRDSPSTATDLIHDTLADNLDSEFDKPDRYFDELNIDGLRRTLSTPMLRERKSRTARKRLNKALEAAVRIASQLEKNSADLLRSVEEHRRKVSRN